MKTHNHVEYPVTWRGIKSLTIVNQSSKYDRELCERVRCDDSVRIAILGTSFSLFVNVLRRHHSLQELDHAHLNVTGVLRFKMKVRRGRIEEGVGDLGNSTPFHGDSLQNCGKNWPGTLKQSRSRSPEVRPQSLHQALRHQCQHRRPQCLLHMKDQTRGDR